MAKTITITDNIGSFQLVKTDTNPSPITTTSNISKGDIMEITLLVSSNITIMPNLVQLMLYGDRQESIDWNLVTSPVVVNASDLYSQLMVMYLNTGSGNVFALSSTFTNANLVGGILSRTHPYGTNNITITVLNPSGVIVTPIVTAVTPLTSPASFTLDFGGAIGAGTYTYVLVATP